MPDNMDQDLFTLEPGENRDLPERQDRCQRAIKAVSKAIFMRLFICGLLLWVVLRTAMDLWVVGLMLLVMFVNIAGILPLCSELKKQRAQWKKLLEEEE